MPLLNCRQIHSKGLSRCSTSAPLSLDAKTASTWHRRSLAEYRLAAVTSTCTNKKPWPRNKQIVGETIFR